MRLNSCFRVLAAIAGIAVLWTQAHAVGFTAGDLVVTRLGDGTTGIAATGTAAFIDEFSVGGAFQQSVAMPTTDSLPQHSLVNSGTATSEGFLKMSANSQYLTLAGYNGTVGATVVASATIARTAARVNISTGAVDTSTILAASGADGNTGNPRSIVSNDGNQFWVGTSAGSVRYTTFGATTGSTRITTDPANTRVVNIYGGQLYVSSAQAGPPAYLGPSSVGTGLPTTSGQTTTLLNGFPTSGSHSNYDYWFKDGATLYVADDGGGAAGGGIQKWTLSGGTWSLQYNLLSAQATPGVRGLSGGYDINGNAVLFGTTTSSSNNSIIEVYDQGASSVPITVASAGTNKVFRGVVYLPSLPLPPPSGTPQPQPPKGFPVGGDLIMSTGSTNPGFAVDIVRGPVSADGGVKGNSAPWTTTKSLESVKFDNYGGILHNVKGNLLGLEFGNTPGTDTTTHLSTGGGTINSYATNGSTIPAPSPQTIGNTVDTNPLGHSTGSVTATRLGAGLSVSPDNSKIAVAGYDSGKVIVYDYTPGNTQGSGAALANGRETATTLLATSNNHGTTWKDNSTVVAFSKDGDITEVNATDMSTTYKTTLSTSTNDWTPPATGNWTALAYNTSVSSQYMYAMYSGFATATATGKDLLFVLDTNNNYNLVNTLDLTAAMTRVTQSGTNIDTGREMALDKNGNLFISANGSNIYYLPDATTSPGSLSAGSLVHWYTSQTFYSFPGMDIGFGLEGDFNGDGKVDAADYVWLRKTYSDQSTPALQAAYTASYNIWRQNFGRTSGSGAGGLSAVPEPASIVLLGIALVGVCCRRQR